MDSLIDFATAWLPLVVTLSILLGSLALLQRNWGKLKEMFKADEPDHDPGGVAGHPQLYLLLQIGTLIAYALIIGVSLVFWDAAFTPLGSGLNFGLFGLVAVGLHLAESIRQIGPDHTGGAYLRGMALKRLAPGLRFAPALLVDVQSFDIHFHNSQFPGPPEKVFRRDDNIPLKEGQVQPIRIVTGGPPAGVGSGVEDILETQMTLETSFIGRWRITDALNFVANYGSVATVEEGMRDVGEATVAEEFSQRTPKKIINDLADINKKLLQDVSARFPHAGFALESFRLVSPDLSHDVSSALANIPTARAKAVQTRIAAAAERDRLTEEGVGAANARFESLAADASGYKKIKESLGIKGELVIAAETARPAAENAKVILAGAKAGTADLFGLVAGAKAAVEASEN